MINDTEECQNESGHYIHEKKVDEEGNETYIVESDTYENKKGLIMMDIDTLDIRQNQDGTTTVHEKDIVKYGNGNVIETIKD